MGAYGHHRGLVGRVGKIGIYHDLVDSVSILGLRFLSEDLK